MTIISSIRARRWRSSSRKGQLLGWYHPKDRWWLVRGGICPNQEDVPMDIGSVTLSGSPAVAVVCTPRDIKADKSSTNFLIFRRAFLLVRSASIHHVHVKVALQMHSPCGIIHCPNYKGGRRYFVRVSKFTTRLQTGTSSISIPRLEIEVFPEEWGGFD